MTQYAMTCLDCDTNPIAPNCGALCASCFELVQKKKRSKEQRIKNVATSPQVGGFIPKEQKPGVTPMPVPWVYVKDETEADKFLTEHPNFSGTVICEDAL